MGDINPELIEKATSAVRQERAYIAAAAFGVPLEDVGECAGMIARVVLSAVADDLRAEGWEQGYRSGHSRAMRRMSDEPNVKPGRNPYRADAIEAGQS